MKYISLFSGIEAATVAWQPLGFQAVAFSEIDKFPSAVLAHHYPDVPNVGDITKFDWSKYHGAADIVIGGSPCQSFSVAGQRRGLDDERGQLMLAYLAAIDRIRPRWLVWENVPGVLSSGGGRDFGFFLGSLAKLGYGFAYRILDAQYWGLAQRRKRVFVVGYLGNWRASAAVLFERESLRRDSPPSRGAEQDVAPTLDVRDGRSGETSFHTSGGLARCLNAGGMKRQDFETETFVTVGTMTSNGDAHSGFKDENGLVPACIKGAAIGREPENAPQYGETLTDGTCYTLNCTEQHAVAFNLRGRESGSQPELTDVASLRASSGGSSRSYIGQSMAVRRLTPKECERLQGFPDGYTDISYRGKPAADGPRYKALGNSMAVPVISWLGKRIQMVESCLTAKRAE